MKQFINIDIRLCVHMYIFCNCHVTADSENVPDLPRYSQQRTKASGKHLCLFSLSPLSSLATSKTLVLFLFFLLCYTELSPDYFWTAESWSSCLDTHLLLTAYIVIQTAASNHSSSLTSEPIPYKGPSRFHPSVGKWKCMHLIAVFHVRCVIFYLLMYFSPLYAHYYTVWIKTVYSIYQCSLYCPF